MICSKCGAQNSDSAMFCGSCGAQLERPVQTETPSAMQQPASENYQKSYDYSQQQNSTGNYGGNPLNGGVVPPKNYMTEAIIVTVVSFLCCCSPISIVLGIIAIVKANNVNSEFNAGRLDIAMQNSESAKKLTIWAAVIAVIFYILIAVLYFFVFAASIASSGGLDNIFNNI